MRFKTLALMFCLALATMGIDNCDNKPDLMPVNPSNIVNWCDIDGGDLTVHIMNQGFANAGSSTTSVDFGGAGTVDVPTPSILSGQTVSVTVPIPGGCFDPDCGFTIEVDYDDDVEEALEDNNTQEGSCLG